MFFTNVTTISASNVNQFTASGNLQTNLIETLAYEMAVNAEKEIKYMSMNFDLILI